MSRKILLIESAAKPLTTLNRPRNIEGRKVSMSLEGVFGQINVVNRNGRTYFKENYQQRINEINALIERFNGVLGELEHPNTLGIDLNNVSHVIDSPLKIEDGTGLVKGGISLLNTHKGKNALAIAEAKLPLFISSRGRGSIDKNGIVTLEEMPTYDLVGTSGFANAMLTQVSESIEYESLNENATIFYLDKREVKQYHFLSETKAEKEAMKDENKEEQELADKIKDAEMTLKNLKDKQKDADSDNDKKDKDGMTDEEKKDLKEAMHAYFKEATLSEIDELRSEMRSMQENFETKVLEKTNQIVEERNSIVLESVDNWVKSFIGDLMNETKVEIAEAIGSTLEKVIKESSDNTKIWTVEKFAPSIGDFINQQIQNSLVNFAEISEKWNEEQLLPFISEYLAEAKEMDGDDDEENDDDDKEKPKDAISESLAKVEKKIEEAYAKKIDETQPLWLRSIPNSKMAFYESLSEADREKIKNKADRTILNSEQTIAAFWRSIDESKFEIEKDESKLDDKLNENNMANQQPQYGQQYPNYVNQGYNGYNNYGQMQQPYQPQMPNNHQMQQQQYFEQQMRMQNQQRAQHQVGGSKVLNFLANTDLDLK